MSLPQGKVKIEWSENFAYAIGLIVSDGCVSNDGRHISFVSVDEEQIHNYLVALDIFVRHGINHSSYKNMTAYRIQFSDTNFWKFLNSIGIGPAKSKTLEAIKIPDIFFFDFLRGLFDGDGCIYSYWDKRWKSSFMFYITFVSASKVFIDWIRSNIEQYLDIKGHISVNKKQDFWQLRYAKKEGVILIKEMYKNKNSVCLNRKKLKIDKILGTMSSTSAN